MGIDTIRKQGAADDSANESPLSNQERSDGIEKYQDAYTKLIQGYKRDLLTEYGCSTREELQEKIQKGDIPIEEALEIKRRVGEMPSLEEILYYYPNGVPPYKCRERYLSEVSVLCYYPAQFGSATSHYAVTLQVSFEGNIIMGGDDGLIYSVPHSEWEMLYISQPETHFIADSANLTALQVLPDGSFISVGYGNVFDSQLGPPLFDGELRLWKKDESGKYKYVTVAKSPFPKNTFHAISDKDIVTGDSDGQISRWLWESTSEQYKEISVGKLEGLIYSVRRFPDGSIVSGDSKGNIILWRPNGESGYDPMQVGKHGKYVSALQVSPDNNIYSSGPDGEIFLWSPNYQGGYSKALVGKQPEGVVQLAVLPGHDVVSCADSGQIYIWRKDGDLYMPPEIIDIENPADPEKLLGFQVLQSGKIITYYNHGSVLEIS